MGNRDPGRRAARDQLALWEVCSVRGCGRPVNYARGLCKRHYDDLKSNGTLPPRLPTYPPPEERFWAKVRKTPTCWLWTGKPTEKGYARFFVEGRSVYVHRYAYELLVGPVPDDRELDHRHTCPKICVNPQHLRPATHKQNAENLSGATARSSTGIRGVFPAPRQPGKFIVEVRHNKKLHRGGTYDRTMLAMQAAIRLRNRLHTFNDADREVAS